MAIDKLSIGGTWDLSGFIKDATTGASLRRKFGAGSIPTLDLPPLAYGTTSGKANWMYFATRTVATVTADNLDLSGSLTDGLGNTITATRLKLLVVAVASPDGTKTIRVGPRGVANANQLNHGGVAASNYIDVTDWAVLVNEPVAGLTVVNASSDVVGLYNPSAGSVTYSILMAGV